MAYKRPIFKKKKDDSNTKKYKNKKVEYDGLTFDSTKEFKRYMFLKEQEDRGVISGLERQIKYELIPSIKEDYVEHLKTKDKIRTRTLQLAITYTCDFKYMYDGKEVIEDVKASPKMIPNDYILKEKLMFWRYGIRIKRVYKPTENIG